MACGGVARGPVLTRILPELTRGHGLVILERLLAEGIDPNDPATGGCPAISACLERMGPFYCCLHSGPTEGFRGTEEKGKKDTGATRELMKAVHLLARHGARWTPADGREIQAARRSLLELAPDYAVEFVWIMRRYGACAEASVRELLRTGSIREHTRAHAGRLRELLEGWPAA